MKTKEDILNQLYISVGDLKNITGFGTNTCRNIINDIEQEMIEKKYYIPETRQKLVLTKLVRKRLGI